MTPREELLNVYESASVFADEHKDDNPDRLLLNAARWPGFDMKIVASTIESRRRLQSKAPLWARTPGLVFPRTLSAQQCSSEVSAGHKARVASRFQPRVIADLTGGIGVDSLAFSQICRDCHYNESDFELSVAAGHNFLKFKQGNNNVKIGNIFVTQYEADSGNEFFWKWLESLTPDMVYLDPARRDSVGNKVFLIEDCSPDLTALQDRLLDIAPVVVSKLSTMADLSMVLSRLKNCSLIQIVEYGGECRELLVVQQRDFSGNCRIEAVNLDLGDESVMSCSREDFAVAPSIASGAELVGGNYIFEPSRALMKTGCYGLMSRILEAGCVARDSHFFILTPERVSQLGESPLLRSGRLSRIIEVARLTGRSIKDFSGKYPFAETIARNVRFTSGELRERLRCRPSDAVRIFALGSDSLRDRILLAAEIESAGRLSSFERTSEF